MSKLACFTRKFVLGGGTIAVIVLLSAPLFAQNEENENTPLRSEPDVFHSQVSVLSTFPLQLSNTATDTDGNSLTNSPTRSGGLLLGYSFRLKSWLRVEGDWAASRNSQRFEGPSGTTELQGDMNQLTVEGQFFLPTHWTRVSPFALTGTGTVKFAPTDFTKFNISEAQSQNKPVFLYGGGADIDMGRGFGLRAEYRGLMTSSPTFDVSGLGTTERLHVIEPVVGLFYKF